MSEGVVLMFNETAHSFFMSVSCLALLLSLLSGLYRVHRLHVSSLCPIACRHFLPLPSFQKVVCFCLFPLFFFMFGLLALSYPLDLGSHFAFLFSSAFVYIPMLCHWSCWTVICFIKLVTLWTPLNFIYIYIKERGDKRRCWNFKSSPSAVFISLHRIMLPREISLT